MDTTSDMVLVADEELQQLAEQLGPTSAEAQVLAQLASQRVQDLQVYAFRVGDQYLTGPLPEAAVQASAPDPLTEALRVSGAPMTADSIEVSKGPTKADLLRAVTNPNEHLHVAFSTPQGLIEARLDAIEEFGDGVTFGLRGHFTSANLIGATFAGTYDTAEGTGKLVYKAPSSA